MSPWKALSNLVGISPDPNGETQYARLNRVENQNEPKRQQGGGRLGSFWFSIRPTAMGGTDYNGL